MTEEQATQVIELLMQLSDQLFDIGNKLTFISTSLDSMELNTRKSRWP